MELQGAPVLPLSNSPVDYLNVRSNGSCQGREGSSPAFGGGSSPTLEPAPICRPEQPALCPAPHHWAKSSLGPWPWTSRPPSPYPYLRWSPDPRDDDGTAKAVKLPETRPLSREQLEADVKAIYAALVMVDMGARLFGDPAMSERMARLVLGLISQRMSRLLYIASEPPEGADAELLRWLQKTEDLFDRLTWRFWGHRVFVWILVSLVFWASSYSFFFEYPRGIRHLCTTMPWTIWPALAVLWGVCWMFIQQQRGGADKGISLLPQQGRHVDTEVPLSPLPPSMVVGDTAWHGAWSSPYEARTAFNRETNPPPPCGAGPSVLQTYGPQQYVHLDSDGSTEWSSHLPYSDMDHMDFPTSGWLSDGPIALQDLEAIEHELSAQVGDAARHHPCSAPPGVLPVLDVLDRSPTLHDVAEHFLSPTPASATRVLNPESSSSHQKQDLRPNRSLNHSIRNMLNRGTPTEKPSSLPAKATSFKCPACGGRFVRKETLDRHMREQNHGVPSAALRDAEEHLCPVPGCRKSVRGKGFKRGEKLREHLAKKSCKPIRQLSKAPLRLPSTSRAAVPFTSSPIDVEIDRIDASEPPTDETGSPERERAPTTESRGGNPTIAERVAFLKRCCQADEEELRAVEQEIRAKEEELVARKRVCQQIRERLAASQSSLDMLTKQHQPLLTFSGPEDGQGQLTRGG